MKDWRRLLLVAALAVGVMGYSSCSKDKGGSVAEEPNKTVTVTFEDAPDNVLASDEEGKNLYSVAPQGTQVTTGYYMKATDVTYVQFPINYIKQYDGTWGYNFSNGGWAVSRFTNVEKGDYKNQCSVYSKGGGHDSRTFAVCYSTEINENGDVSKYAKIYFTDKVGYTKTRDGVPVTGKAKLGKFNSVWVCNTTYAYITMQKGNTYTNGSLQSHNGWFKVVFRALDAEGKLVPGKQVEYYLANFDASRRDASGLDGKIREGWNQVDLSPLGDNVAALVVGFDGSDKGAYGLNTPMYVAIDDLNVTVSE